MKYIPEIDGLRALSVLGVLFYHIFPNLVPGGFLGVDIFFTISGFLIGSIILEKVESNTFSVKEFWIRRFKRLYPNLLVMILTTLVCGIYLLINPFRQELTNQVISSILACSNFLFWKTTGGYWDTKSDNIPLLHTWSLGIEEQFYLFLPFCILLLKSCFRQIKIPNIILLCSFLSFVLSIIRTPIAPSAAFYLLPTRAWEFGIGLYLASLSKDKKKICPFKLTKLSFYLGVLLILSFFFIINDKLPLPGWYPFFSCCGAALVISSSTNISSKANILSSGLMPFIGKMSYSLYLWHWPIVVLAGFLFFDTPKILLLAFTFVISYISFLVVESPFRKASTPSVVVFCLCCLGIICPLLVFNSFRSVSPGLPEKLRAFEDSTSIKRGWQFEATGQILKKGKGLYFGNLSKDPSIILVGSSHARIFGEALKEFAERENICVLILATSQYGLANESKKGNLINQKRINIIKEKAPETIIYAGRWTSEIDNDKLKEKLPDILNPLSSSSKKVVILSQIPSFVLPKGYEQSIKKLLLTLNRSNKNAHIKSDDKVDEANLLVKKIVSQQNNIKLIYVDTNSFFKSSDNQIKYSDTNKFLFSDDNHLNDYGASLVFSSLVEKKIKN